MKSIIQRLAAGLAVLVVPMTLLAQPTDSDWRRPWGLNLPTGATELSQDVYSLHMLVFWIVCVIGLVVFGGVFYSVWKFRKSRGAVAARWHHSTAVEIIWTVIPFLILLVIAVPATRTMIAMEDTGEYDMTIKVTGYQWMWQYEYLDEGVDFYSRLHPDSDRARQRNPSINPQDVDNYLLEVDNPLVLPVGSRVRFLITANDVIHAWWVPELGWKKDAIPGFINEAWAQIDEPGIYRGQCAELCGRDHGFMPVVVIAKEQDDYLAWLDGQRSANEAVAAADGGVITAALTAADGGAAVEPLRGEALLAHGGDVYARECAACHQPQGQGMATFPALAGNASLADDAYVTDVLLNGIAGSAMVSFGSRLDDNDIAGVLSYIRSNWGNELPVIAPEDIRAAR